MASSTLIIDYLGEGTHAARPAAPVLPTGGIGIYFETDTGETFLWDTGGAAWVKIAGASVGSVTSVATGNGLTGGPITTTGTISAAVTLSSKTTAYNVLSADAGVHFDNIGAAGSVNFSLPAAGAGLFYAFLCHAAHSIVVTANGTDVISYGAISSSAGGTITAATPFAFVALESHATGQWVASSMLGGWVAA